MTRDQAVIKLDIDNVRRPPSLRDLRQILRRAGYTPVAVGERRSPSGNGWHMWIHVRPRPKSPYEIVALEAICGGDRQRCAMQMQRAKVFSVSPRVMRDAWNVLYAPHPQRQRRLRLPEDF